MTDEEHKKATQEIVVAASYDTTPPPQYAGRTIRTVIGPIVHYLSVDAAARLAGELEEAVAVARVAHAIGTEETP